MTLQDLHAIYLNLESAWGAGWPGLPRVLEGCLTQLGRANLSGLSARDRALESCCRELAEFIELGGQALARSGDEPAYHNRLHIADTLVGLTVLLLVNREIASVPDETPSHAEWLAMLATLAHDLLHDGTVNRFPEELESRAVKHLEPFMKKHRVSKADQRVIGRLILMTEPGKVPHHHAQMVGRPYDIGNPACLGVLVEEADILPSCFRDIGARRTASLLAEWRKTAPHRVSMLEDPRARINFLQYAGVFSSPASRRLGIDEMVAEQLRELRQSGDAV